jgi:hypothetical protein
MAANPSSGGSPPTSGGSSRRSTPPDALPGATPGLLAAGREKRGAKSNAADAKVQTFRSPTALVVWVVWLLFAAANWVDLAVQGRDHISAVAAAILLLATGLAYVTAQRPRIIADEAGITVRNPLRDHRIGWASVTKVDLVDLLRVHCDRGRQAGRPRVTRSTPRSSAPGPCTTPGATRSRPRPRRAAGPAPGVRPSACRAAASAACPTAAQQPVPPPPPPRPKRKRSPASSTSARPPLRPRPSGPPAPPRASPPKNHRTTTAPAPVTAPAPTTSWLEPLKSTWSRKAIAAIIIPALILLIVCLL